MISNPTTSINNPKKTATLHWLMQRITAVILVPLSFKLIVFLDLCINEPYQQSITWLQNPINGVSLGVWLLAVFYHAALGLQVVVEDYIGNQGLQSTIIKAINLGFLSLMAATLFFMFRAI